MNAPVVEKAVLFDRWLRNCVTKGSVDDLLDYMDRAPHARWNHLSGDHFLPLLVAAGAANGDPGRLLHQSFVYGVLSMAAYGWGC